MNEYVIQGATAVSSSSARSSNSDEARSRRGSCTSVPAGNALTGGRTPHLPGHRQRDLFAMHPPWARHRRNRRRCERHRRCAEWPRCRSQLLGRPVGVTQNGLVRARMPPGCSGRRHPRPGHRLRSGCGKYTTMESAMVVTNFPGRPSSWLFRRGRGTPRLRPAPCRAAGALSPWRSLSSSFAIGVYAAATARLVEPGLVPRVPRDPA